LPDTCINIRRQDDKLTCGYADMEIDKRIKYLNGTGLIVC
jgi:hypothetical protein